MENYLDEDSICDLKSLYKNCKFIFTIADAGNKEILVKSFIPGIDNNLSDFNNVLLSEINTLKFILYIFDEDYAFAARWWNYGYETENDLVWIRNSYIQQQINHKSLLEIKNNISAVSPSRSPHVDHISIPGYLFSYQEKPDKDLFLERHPNMVYHLDFIFKIGFGR